MSTIQTESRLLAANTPGGAHRRLFVLVPEAGHTCTEWKPLLDRLRMDLPYSEWLLYDHHRRISSSRTISSAGADLAAAINEIYENHKPYDAVTLIGHGLGGILVRSAYLMGSGKVLGRYNTGKKEWSDYVDRIVLFSAFNRGFDPRRLGWKNLPIRAALLIPRFRLARDYMKGSSFIADLRISWIRHFRDLERSGGKEPTVIQLRGAKDKYLHAEDSADVDQFVQSTQEIVEGVGHADIFKFPKGQETERYLFLRRQILEAAGSPVSPHTDPPGVTKDVVFLVHGIRACNSQWPTRAARIIEQQYPNAIAVQAGYSYFSALNFAIPFMRRRQIRWMQDEYAYRFARHPGARFHFLGHSNGTYLLGRMLEKVPNVKFTRVTLVGSVLPEDFDWKNHLGERVDEYQNHRAASDLPVSLLCSLLRGFFMRDIGTAGFSGFLPGDTGHEVFYYKGGHGAALQDNENLRRIVHYTITGESMNYAASSETKIGLLPLGSRMMPYAAIPLIVLVVGAIIVAAQSLAFLWADNLRLSLTETTFLISTALFALVVFVLKVI